MEWMSDGLRKPRRGATSRVMRKYGSWSMAHGIRHGTFCWPAIVASKTCGKDDENDGAACTAGKACLPMLTESSKPKMPLTWLYVTGRGVNHYYEGVDHYHEGADLVVRDGLLDLEDVRVHVADVVEVGEDERARDVEAARDDVLRVLEACAAGSHSSALRGGDTPL